MALTDKLTAIADAIRTKSGKTDAITLAEMSTEILNITTSEVLLKPSEYPDYVRKEINRVADAVRNVLTSNSIVSICLSDSHYPADEATRKSAVHAMMAIKGLTYVLPVDFIAHLGDVGYEGPSATEADTERLQANLIEMLKYVKESNGSSIPLFVAIGNHDNGNYVTNTDSADMVQGEFLYNNLTALSASENTVFSGEANGGYCYRDFPSKKLRVFLLNTSEGLITGGYSNDKAASETQLAWFASKLQELNTKSDASEWGIIVLCHYPADYGNSRPLSGTIAAYVHGTSVTLNGTSYNFNGANAAKFIVQHHGHIHNFLHDKLYTGNLGSQPTQFNAWRVAIPNTQNNRENYYGEFNLIDYSEGETYTKVADSAKDTSFVVNVINPSEEKIYSFCYGAGYDRVIGYGDVTYYSVALDMTNATVNNMAVSVEEGKSYSNTIAIKNGCDLKKISVTMGGVDISGDAIENVDGTWYQINIPSVTGNVVITAKAQAQPNFTNLVPLSINTDGSDYYVDGDGYDNGVRFASGDVLSEQAQCVVTGFIPIAAGEKTIRIAGEGISASTEYTAFNFYDANFNLTATILYRLMGIPHSNGTYYNGELIEEESTAITMKLHSKSNGVNCVYMRICANGAGENLVVTVDEEITYGGDGGGNTDITYAVVRKLTNVQSSNTSAGVTSGGSYSATLTADDGYELGDVTVTMGGLDVTSSVYASGQITIANVIGNIVITATANAVVVKYTNQLPISTDTDGSVFNGVGYKANSYLSSGNVSTKSGYYATGFIPVKAGDTIYFKNCTLQSGQSYHRFCFYKSDKTYFTIKAMVDNQLLSDAGITITYGDDGKVSSFAISSSSPYYTGNDLGYIRFCCSYLGEDSIVTVNEPIE